MNQNSTQEDLAQLYNELRKIDIAINQNEKILKLLLSQTAKVKNNAEKNKHYGIETEFTPGNLNPKTIFFTIDKHTIFRPISIDWSLTVNFTDKSGVLVNRTAVTGDSFNVGTARNMLFSFLLSISDTGSNREWQNAPIPDTFLLGGILSPFYFGVGERGVLGGDSQVTMEIQPTMSSTVFDNDVVINNYSVIIAMSGHEELLHG